MITSEHERARAGEGPDFTDTVALDFCDPEHDLFGAVWLTRLPNTGRSRASAILFSGGDVVFNTAQEADAAIADWHGARLDGVSMKTAQPLERWTLETEGEQGAVRLDADALTAPRELPGELLHGDRCRAVRAALQADGHGRRRRSYFPRSLPRQARALVGQLLLEQDRALARCLCGVRRGPRDQRRRCAPDRERRPRRRAAGGALSRRPRALPFEDVRLSTVYGEDGMPVKGRARALATRATRYPQRLGRRRRLRSASRSVAVTSSIVSFFRWSIDGEPAYGCYELARRA